MERSYSGRREDWRLVTGTGHYADDHVIEGEAKAVFLRSDRAHARIERIDISAAKAVDGVIGILTGEDIVAAGLKSPTPISFFKGVNGSTLRNPYRPALVKDRVRFVGEPLALIVAQTEALARDVAELIEVEYSDLPVVIAASEALSPEAVRLHEDMPDNLAIEFAYGDQAATDEVFATAEHRVRVEVTAQRLAGNPMEPRSCVAKYDSEKNTFEIWLPSQGISDLKTTFAHVTGLDRDTFLVHSIDVGGGFGVRNEVYPEFIAVLWAARQFNVPVKWTGTRLETISADHHGRAAELTGDLALAPDGRFLALRVQWLVNCGAYCSSAGPLINTASAAVQSATSLYAVPTMSGNHKLVFTNTTPTTAYRGAGRPNVAYLWERLVEEAARHLGVDNIELRRLNALKKEQFPFKTPTGSTYDSADPVGLLERALHESDWAGFETRRTEAKSLKKLRGIGCALFIEPSGTAAREEARVEFAPDGRLLLYCNAGPSGQGHETVYPQIVADLLGLPEETIELRYNDPTQPRMAGTGTYGSRSTISHGAVLAIGANEVIRKARDLAASELEVSPQDMEFENGRFHVSGTDLAIDLKTIVKKFAGSPEHPLNSVAALDAAAAFPSGAHVAEVEIDSETGVVEIVNYVAVDDCGTVYNHTLVEGQLHGGLMQGFGQALGEHVVYSADGQLLSGSFMDYFMPRADALPRITLVDRPVPSPSNILGAKGAGEAGATGSVPTLANAVLDALKPLGIMRLDMPFTPYRVWSAIQNHLGPESMSASDETGEIRSKPA